MTKQNKNLFDVLDEARVDLGKIPGVASVGLGMKEASGDVTDRLALRVYVDRKWPKWEVKPSEVIPREFQGVKPMC